MKKTEETRSDAFAFYSPFDCDGSQRVDGGADGDSLEIGHPAADSLAVPPLYTTAVSLFGFSACT